MEMKKSGVGLPYAPEDWPNPGDLWSWKLGKRISTDGFYRDRILYLPPRLHQKGKKKYFDSKKSVITYLQSEFPDTDIDAFFRSFTWKVPGSFSITCEKVDKHNGLSSDELQNLAQVTPHPRKVHPRSKSGKIGETVFNRRSWRLVMSKASSKKRIRFSPKEVKDIIVLSSWSNRMGSWEPAADKSNSATDSRNIRASFSQNTGSQSSKDGTHCHFRKEILPELIPNDSGMLIDTADSFPSQTLPKSSDAGPVSQSLPKSSDAGPVYDQSATSQEKILEARIKLLLLLATDDPVMHSSVRLPKIMHLWSLLKTDPNIDATQQGILKLKLIDEFSLAWKEFQENKKIAEAGDKFSEDLEINIAWAITLENEYIESKGYEYILRKELDSISQNIEKIHIIAQQSQRDDSINAADEKKKAVDMLISKQNKVAECLSKVVDEVEMGKKRMKEWKLKKKRSERKKARTFSKFGPLQDFSLQAF